MIDRDPSSTSGMIDIHSHLLPGVDDGSRSMETSVGVLGRFGQDGVSTLVCTPHLVASAAATAPAERYAELFAELVAAAPATPSLMLGWEIMLDVPGADLRLPHLRLGPSSAVLVELPRNGVPSKAAEELFRIRMSGVVPILAHPERYWGCSVDQVREWRRVGAFIQSDSAMLLGTGPQAELARDMLAEGLIDCLASDNHGDSRSLATARDWLIDLGAPEAAELLTKTNAGLLLADQDPLDVPPVRVDRGMVARLRDLVRRRR